MECKTLTESTIPLGRKKTKTCPDSEILPNRIDHICLGLKYRDTGVFITT